MIILLTNDDGIGAPGLASVEHAVMAAADSFGNPRIVTVAPAFPHSGASRAVTMNRPVRCEEVGPDRFQLDGTPADCVTWALKFLISDPVGAAISGINHGPNLGHDVTYSGTVSAALEAARAGIPSLAISLAADSFHDFSHAATFTVEALRRLIEHRPPPGVAVSVNVPGGKPKGVRVTRPGARTYADNVIERTDPFGRSYYWLAGDGRLGGAMEPGTDILAVAEGFISISALDSDLHAPYTDLSSWQTT
jgi:5'-nucleotidase